jgi:hypothetical protein
MADKRISQLIERTDIANNDVLPIVASGATTTNKVTISTIQDWMQDNLDVGVTSVGITLGTTGTDVNVSGSPITTSGNITINIPDASTSARGVVTTGTQTFAGNKSFQNTIFVNAGLRLDQNGTALPTFVQNISGTGLISSGSNGLGFNSANNLYFSGSEKGGAVLAVNNSAVRTYTLQDANGTLAFTSDIPSLTGYVTLNTAQTITAQKTFSTSGSSDTAIINHGSGSGIALNITKAGNGEGLRVSKTSGSGNAVTITGGTLSAEAGQFSGDLQTSTRISATSGSNAITITPNVGGTQNRIETTGSLPLSLVSAAAITMAAGGTTPQITLATTGAVTLTGALGGTSASFSGSVTSTTNEGFIIAPSSGASYINYKIGATSYSLIGVAGATSDFIAGSALGDLNIRSASSQKILFSTNNGSSPCLTLSSTGAATFSSSVTAAGNIFTENDSVFSTAGSITRHSVVGLVSRGVTGSVFDWSVYSAGGTALIQNPTGTNNIGFSGGQVSFTGGNVGIGTASPVGKFEISSFANNYDTAPAITLTDIAGNANSNRWIIGNIATDYGSFNIASAPSPTSTTFTPRLTINRAGNVGIGTASPTAILHTLKSGTPISPVTDEVFIGQRSGTGQNAVMTIVSDGASIIRLTNAANIELGKILYDTASNFMRFDTNSTERMRITSGGELYWKVTDTTGAALSDGGVTFRDSGSNKFIQVSSGLSTDGLLLAFYKKNGSGVTNTGTIETSGNSTNYNTTSDYRIKEDFQQINGLEKLSKIKVYDFKWKDSEDRMDGVLAHELQEVLPYAVTGQKDAVDENGNDKIQGVDYSKIVPVLIKAIQELKTEIDSLKNQIK